jgi:hypothetical protein
MDGQQKKKILSRCIDTIDQKLNFLKMTDTIGQTSKIVTDELIPLV